MERRKFTQEFKLEAVRLIKDRGVSYVQASQDLNVHTSQLRNWVKASAAGKLTAPGAKPVTPEQMELSRLRAENARLKMHVDILKKATAYFARDAL